MRRHCTYPLRPGPKASERGRTGHAVPSPPTGQRRARWRPQLPPRRPLQQHPCCLNQWRRCHQGTVENEAGCADGIIVCGDRPFSPCAASTRPRQAFAKKCCTEKDISEPEASQPNQPGFLSASSTRGVNSSAPVELPARSCASIPGMLVQISPSEHIERFENEANCTGDGSAATTEGSSSSAHLDDDRVTRCQSARGTTLRALCRLRCLFPPAVRVGCSCNSLPSSSRP